MKLMLRVVGVVVSLLTLVSAARAQSVAPPPAIPPLQLPPVIVTAQKEPADVRTLPMSVTAVGRDALWNTGAILPSDAAVFAPNTYFNEFTARKLSNPRFRGVGSSPANPGVTVYIDGVPQLNANTSSVDLLDVDRIELVRGPQSMLFGRNALGGLINIASVRPSLSEWTGSAYLPLGNASSREVRAGASGPLVDGRVGVGASIAFGERDGFTRNAVTGRTVDDRSAFTAKGQVLWTPADDWEARVIVSGERARDGDYALHDLASLRRDPFSVARDFEGFTHRDIVNTTALVRHEGARFAVTSTTGFIKWKTDDATDLDYTPLPLVTRNNAEEAFQFTQEVRVASAANAPLQLSDGTPLRWQGGVFLFTQNYDQLAVNQFAPLLLSPLLPVSVSQTSPEAALDDVGVGVFGQATATLRERLDVTAGLRFDHESKDARLSRFYTPAIAPPSLVTDEKGFSNLSPQLAATFRIDTERTVYASITSGFKAGGFNPAAPEGASSFDEEQTWNLEAGVKASALGGRLLANAAVFFTDWDDLQLNLPNPFVPGEFYIANVGTATSKGVEADVTARLAPAASGLNVDLFGTLGITRARFGSGSVSRGVSVGGNDVPNAPEYTASLGAQLSHELTAAATLYGRGEAVFTGSYFYDDANTEGQDAYSLVNVRAGVRGRRLFAETWIKNAFDTRYIPVAFEYQPFAASGFVGETGRPRTFGVTLGATF